jgi:hypothetical protein
MRPRWHLAAGLAGWLIAGGGLSGAPAQAADVAPIACPATFSPPRPDIAAEPGWQAVWSGDPVEQLAGIEMTHGPREALEYLAPEDRYEDRQIIQTWDLRSYAGDPEPIWLHCKYTNTAVWLARALPRSVGSCTLTATDTGSGGLGRPVSAVCR